MTAASPVTTRSKNALVPAPSPPKIAVISGGSSGIGLACARVLLGRGYRIALLARDPARLRAAATELGAGGNVDLLPVDVTDAAACQAAIGEIASKHGRIDWLITSAGIVEPGLFRDLDLSAHRAQMETNYFGTLHLIQAAIPVMGRHGGRITLVSSGAAFIGIAGYSGYAPGKFAVRALAEILRLELAEDGIVVSFVAPPDTETPQLEGERPKRLLVTRLISEQGGTLTAGQVAERMIAQAETGAFFLAPSRAMAWLAQFHSLYRPILAWQQRRILKRSRESDRKS
ncbi:MAG: SDR family NAD(P)-dependent oxidoreductase [Hyphomicrobiales bacterium]|nr:MAG: SDR family NAD(P)-dependent oxidoreductase [Hyphomicrobiales bacterium]